MEIVKEDGQMVMQSSGWWEIQLQGARRNTGDSGAVGSVAWPIMRVAAQASGVSLVAEPQLHN